VLFSDSGKPLGFASNPWPLGWWWRREGRKAPVQSLESRQRFLRPIAFRFPGDIVRPLLFSH
jgi:hypothetical protein